MKKILTTVFCLVVMSQLIVAQDTINIDTTKHEVKNTELRKAQRKLARKEMTQHFSIGFDAMYAYLNSTARFEGINGILSAQIDLEKHLGLEDRKMIYSGSIIYRITPRSGLYGIYYQLNRKKDHMLNRDIVFLGDTIKKGVLIGGYLKTSVASFGYLFSILTEQKAFLGSFLNIYVIDIRLGVQSEVFNFEKSARYYAAWPNFGFMASFEIKKWLTLSGSTGIFFINIGDANGTFNDLHLLAEFNLSKWVGISVGYHVFDVRASFPEEYFTAYVNYNYKGPSFGLSFRF